MMAPPRILSIAGSDSSGGAGIQADIKTITMLGGYAMTAITAVTAQNTVGVQGITPLPGSFVREQIDSCLGDIGADAIKLGMLHDSEVIGAVAEVLTAQQPRPPLVLDPVMVASSGAALITQDAIEQLRAQLFPLAAMLTPNLPELELLSGRELRDTRLVEMAAAELARTHGCHVLAKGGHTGGEGGDAQVIDILVPPDGLAEHFSHARIDTRHTHGTGCTLSSAIATLLGHGLPMAHAVKLGRNFVLKAIEAAPGFGAGQGPLGHQAVRGG